MTLPERIAETTGKEVYYHRIAAPYWSNPVSFLEGENFKPGKAKVFIYGSAERYLLERFVKTFHVDFSTNENSALRSVFEDYLFPENTEFLYNTILKKNYLTHKLYSAVNTFKFKAFEYIPSQTPRYILEADSNFIFFHESVDHYYRNFTENELSKIADNLEKLSTTLKQKFGLELILIPVPEQYTIYNENQAQGRYNNMLPRLYEKLEEKEVSFIQLYEPFMNSEKLVFFKTDTHWNKNGVDIAHELVMKQINSLYAQIP
jgi:hypothetical protein